jgi:outer membrane protein TolC
MVSLLAAGCAAGAGAREHDAMVAALRGLDRERPAAAPGELALDAGSLDRAQLVAAVLARNPELDVARETWRAAVAAYPAAVALADPMVTYEVAPFSVAADVPFGQRIELAQKLPYPGKLPLAGDAALAGADAARADYGLLRLALAEAAVAAFDDYYVAARALDVNAHHRALLERIGHSATAQYSVGRAGPQDPLEAEGALIALDRERLMLDAQDRAAIARINRLLRRSPEAPLPPPPAALAIAVPSPSPPATDGVVDPKLPARARIRARAAELAAAERAFYPDLELMTGYDSMFGDWQHRFTVGLAIEIPLERDGRRGSVERARAALAGAAAELVAVTDTLAEDRARGRRDVDEATAALALYEQRAVPNARARVDAALAGFTTGQAAFSTVMMAEHALREVELAVERARADLDRRIATLDRLNGRIAGGGR